MAEAKQVEEVKKEEKKVAPKTAEKATPVTAKPEQEEIRICTFENDKDTVAN